MRVYVGLKELSHERDFTNFSQKFTEISLSKGTRLVFNFFRCSNDFITQKVYFSLFMRVYVGLINSMGELLIFVIPADHKWSIIVH
jgi:hypothetical protein